MVLRMFKTHRQTDGGGSERLNGRSTANQMRFKVQACHKLSPLESECGHSKKINYKIHKANPLRGDRKINPFPILLHSNLTPTSYKLI
jgi:hypothetical protein